MISYCNGCKKKHDDFQWKATWQTDKIVYYCSKFFKPQNIEHIPQSMKTAREKYVKSMLQPWRSGEPSAEYIEAYPKLAKKMFTTKEILKSKPVWGDTPNIKNWRKTI